MNVETVEIVGDEVNLTVVDGMRPVTFTFTGKVQTTMHTTSDGYMQLTVAVRPRTPKVDPVAGPVPPNANRR